MLHLIGLLVLHGNFDQTLVNLLYSADL